MPSNTKQKQKKKSRQLISDLIMDFLEYCEIEKGHSQLTVRNYDHYLQRFLEFTGDITPDKIDRELVKNYRLWLNRKKDKLGHPMKPITQNYHIIALRTFLKYLAQQDIETLDAAKIELAKVGERQITFLEANEVDELLAAPDTSTLTGKRDQAILELLFSTGLRVSELVKLSRDSVNLEKKEFSVKGKGGKVRVVFMSDPAREALKSYLAARHDDFPALFTKHMGVRIDAQTLAPEEEDDEKERFSYLTPRTIQRIIQKYARAVGITKHVTPHTLRHSFATDLLSGGADLRAVQELLGHSSVTTTQIYTHVTDKHLGEVHEAFHGRQRGTKEKENNGGKGNYSRKPEEESKTSG